MIPLRGGCKGNLEGCEKTDNTELGLWEAQDLCNCVKTETLDSLNRRQLSRPRKLAMALDFKGIARG